MADEKISHIPDHQLLRCIGSGSYGEVWLARSITGAYRAVKMVCRKTFEHARPFDREFTGILKFEPISRTHAGLVQILHVGRNDPAGYFFYIMELGDDQMTADRIDPDRYVPKTLSTELTRRGRIPVEECIQIGALLSSALEHLHSHELIHRDIKPSNIIFMNGVPKLADIGLVAGAAEAQSFVGTEGFIPPEGPGTAQADLYSLGKVLYEASTGKDRLEFPELPDDLAEMPDMDGLLRLNEVILKACDTDVRKRYQTAHQLRVDLEQLRQGRRLQVSGSLSHNLPVQLTSFIGRQKEMAEVNRLLRNTRLLTLTGTGGCGKTRLALEVAAGLLEEFPDGVWLAELAPQSDPALVPQTVASVLGIREEPRRPLLATLSDDLRPKQLLLLLDNCEHLIGACAQFAEALLKACPHVKILATSREGLDIPGELTWTVPSLSVPGARPGHDISLPASELAQYEAVQLFVDRAAAGQPKFALTDQTAPAVAQICCRLDGIPLAIELAAARTRALTTDQIAARLDDRFLLLTQGKRTELPRHQTLRAVIDWSYDLLSDAERALFLRLSVFAGGWALEAAEAVCAGDGIEQAEVLDLLTHLVDKSLVIAEAAGKAERYRMLETVQRYSHDRLMGSGRMEATRNQHLKFFLGLAEQAQSELRGGQQKAWLDRLETEHDNLRAALAWALETEPVAGLKLAGSLSRFWEVRGYFSEVRQWLERALAQASQVPAEARAGALESAGFLAWRQTDHQRALGLLEECLRLNRELGNEQGVAKALRMLGNVASDQGNNERAWALYEEALVLARKAGDKWNIWALLNNLGIVELQLGDYPRASALYQESLAISKELGDKLGVAYALGNLGEVAHDQRDYAKARDYYEQSLDIARGLGDKYLVGLILNNLGEVARAQGDLERAGALNTESLTIARELGNKKGIAATLEGLANVAGAQGQAGCAAKLFGAAEALREAIGVPMEPSKRAEHDRIVAAVRSALGEDAIAAAWAEGRAMTLEQAIAYALGASPSGTSLKS